MLRDPLSSDNFPSRPAGPEDKPSAMRFPAVANLTAVVSLTLGIISLLRLGLISGALAIALGFLAGKDCTKPGIARAGIVCGCITIGFVLLLVFLLRNAGPPASP